MGSKVFSLLSVLHHLGLGSQYYVLYVIVNLYPHTCNATILVILADTIFELA